MALFDVVTVDVRNSEGIGHTQRHEQRPARQRAPDKSLLQAGACPGNQTNVTSSASFRSPHPPRPQTQ